MTDENLTVRLWSLTDHELVMGEFLQRVRQRPARSPGLGINEGWVWMWWRATTRPVPYRGWAAWQYVWDVRVALGKIDSGGCDEALDKLGNDIVAKTNGCAESDTGEPDRNDWLITCEAQDQVYPLLMQAVGLLENGGGPCCP